MVEPTAKDHAWNFRDEEQYSFIEKKFSDRRKLYEAAQYARKLADEAEPKDNQPNPQARRLRLEADMAIQRYEMAYIVDKNKQLQQIIEPLEFVFQRLSILEGAYSHVKTLGDNMISLYRELQIRLKSEPHKEQPNGRKKD